MELTEEDLQSIGKIENEISDIKLKLAQIKERTITDDDALGGDILKLEKRLIFAEKEIGKLKLQKSG